MFETTKFFELKNLNSLKKLVGEYFYVPARFDAERVLADLTFYCLWIVVHDKVNCALEYIVIRARIGRKNSSVGSMSLNELKRTDRARKHV